jgi:hypothetical protein
VIEKQYPGARVYPDAVELAKRLMPALKNEVDRRLQALPIEQAAREKGLALASDAQRAELTAVAEREQAAADASIEKAESQGIKWPPLIVRNEKSLSTLSSLLPNEIQRLNGIEVTKLRQSLQLAEQARASFAKKEYDAAEETLRKSTELWQTNEIATRVQAELASARSAAQPEAPPEVTPEPTTDTTSTDSNENSGTDGSDSQEKPRPFLLTAPGAITVIVVLALAIAGYTTYKKLKSRASDVLE